MTEESQVLPPIKKVEVPLPKIVNRSHDAEHSEQSTRPCGFDPRRLHERLSGGYRVVIKKGQNRVVLLRFLLAKLAYSVEGLSIEEYLTVFHLYYDLLDVNDPLFLKKYEGFLTETQVFLESIRGETVFPIQCESENLVWPSGLFPSKREYFGLAGQRDLRRSFRVVLNDTLLPQKLPPCRFIGVGYKDKGTRRDPALDGSPSWKEVAKINSFREREAEELGSPENDPAEAEEFLGPRF